MWLTVDKSYSSQWREMQLPSYLLLINGWLYFLLLFSLLKGCLIICSKNELGIIHLEFPGKFSMPLSKEKYIYPLQVLKYNC